MKKHLNKILIALLVVAVVVGIGFLLKKYNKEQANPASFTSPDGTFSTDLPKSWDARLGDQTKSSVVVTFVTDSIVSTSNSKPYINIAKGAASTDLVTAYNETVVKYKKLFKKFKVVSENDIQLSGVPGKKLVFDGTLGGKMIRYSILFAIHENQVYTITASSSVTDAEQLAPVVDGLAQTWKFLEK